MFYLFVLGKILSLAFPRSLAYYLAERIALLHYAVSKQDRETVKFNLSHVIGKEGELNGFVRKVFINFAYYLVDFFRYAKLKEKFIKKYVRITGRNYFDRSLASGKGTIILSAHLGNYELGAAIVSLLGYPLSVVALPHRKRSVNSFFNHQRKSVGLDVIPTNLSVRKCVTSLNNGEAIAFLGDRDFTGAGLKVKFFSQDAVLPRGPAFFALKTAASIVPTFLIREGKKFYRLAFEEPIICGPGSLNSEEKIIAKYITILEKYIARYPSQWYMFEKFWLNSEKAPA